MVKTGASVTLQFLTSDANGALANADSAPTGTLVKNGTATADTVTVTNVTTGIYTAAVTIPFECHAIVNAPPVLDTSVPKST